MQDQDNPAIQRFREKYAARINTLADSELWQFCRSQEMFDLLEEIDQAGYMRGKEEVVEERNYLLDALGRMWNQYCGKNGHQFMNAGETAAEVLMKSGILKDEWSEIDYDILDSLTTLTEKKCRQ